MDACASRSACRASCHVKVGVVKACVCLQGRLLLLHRETAAHLYLGKVCLEPALGRRHLCLCLRELALLGFV